MGYYQRLALFGRERIYLQTTGNLEIDVRKIKVCNEQVRGSRAPCQEYLSLMRMRILTPLLRATMSMFDRAHEIVYVGRCA